MPHLHIQQEGNVGFQMQNDAVSDLSFLLVVRTSPAFLFKDSLAFLSLAI